MPSYKVLKTETCPDLALQELANWLGPKGDIFSWHLTSGLAIWKAIIKKSLKSSKPCFSGDCCLFRTQHYISHTIPTCWKWQCCSSYKPRSFQCNCCEQSLETKFLRARLIIGVWKAPHSKPLWSPCMPWWHLSPKTSRSISNAGGKTPLYRVGCWCTDIVEVWSSQLIWPCCSTQRPPKMVQAEHSLDSDPGQLAYGHILR